MALAALPDGGLDLSPSALPSQCSDNFCSAAFAAVILGLCGSFRGLPLAVFGPLQRQVGQRGPFPRKTARLLFVGTIEHGLELDQDVTIVAVESRNHNSTINEKL